MPRRSAVSGSSRSAPSTTRSKPRAEHVARHLDRRGGERHPDGQLRQPEPRPALRDHAQVARQREDRPARDRMPVDRRDQRPRVGERRGEHPAERGQEPLGVARPVLDDPPQIHPRRERPPVPRDDHRRRLVQRIERIGHPIAQLGVHRIDGPMVHPHDHDPVELLLLEHVCALSSGPTNRHIPTRSQHARPEPCKSTRSRDRTGVGVCQGVGMAVALADVVTVSSAVGATRSRLAKVAAMAELLRPLRGEDAVLVASFLAGEPRQPRLDVGWAALRDVRPEPAAVDLAHGRGGRRRARGHGRGGGAGVGQAAPRRARGPAGPRDRRRAGVPARADPRRAAAGRAGRHRREGRRERGRRRGGSRAARAHALR